MNLPFTSSYLRSVSATMIFVEGHHAHSCSHGDEALAAYKRFAPWDWVITDFQFGRGEIIQDGLQLMHYIRRIDPQQQIIVQTSEEYLPLPYGVKFLRKPFLPRTLVNLMRIPVHPLLPLQ